MLKYFTSSESYPRDEIVDDPLPMGVYYEYVSNSFLNGFVNYAIPVKAYVLDRYTTWDEDLDGFTIQVQEPPGSFKWTEFKPKTKKELYDRLIVPGGTYHVGLDRDFQDDVVMLSVSRTGKTYLVMWFDRDNSDCSIGRFQTSDTREQVMDEFTKWVDSLQLSENNAHMPIPLHYFQGWMSS